LSLSAAVAPCCAAKVSVTSYVRASPAGKVPSANVSSRPVSAPSATVERSPVVAGSPSRSSTTSTCSASRTWQPAGAVELTALRVRATSAASVPVFSRRTLAVTASPGASGVESKSSPSPSRVSARLPVETVHSNVSVVVKAASVPRMPPDSAASAARARRSQTERRRSTTRGP
jgi:hypothetical protein